MSYLTFGLSVQCKNKEHINQDKYGSVIIRSPSGKDILVAAVSDGVTMCYKGEIASYNTVRFILNWAAEHFSENDFNAAIIPEDFDVLITKINRKLNQNAKRNNRKTPKTGYSPFSSCTLCCVITDGVKILYFNVGDSTIYELKNYTTLNVVGVGKHTNTSGRLTSYVGGIEDAKLDIRFLEGEFDSKAAYFLCTDGMSNQIVFNIDACEDFRRFNQRLITADSKGKGITVLEGMAEYVVSKGETDDVTALVVKSAF